MSLNLYSEGIRLVIQKIIVLKHVTEFPQCIYVQNAVLSYQFIAGNSLAAQTNRSS